MQSPTKDYTTKCEDISKAIKPLQSIEADIDSQEQLSLSSADQGNSGAATLTPQDKLKEHDIVLAVTDDKSNEAVITKVSEHKTRKKRTKGLQKRIQDQVNPTPMSN